MTFKERRYECLTCGAELKRLGWNTDLAPSCIMAPEHGDMTETGLATTLAPNGGLVTDTIIGGRWVETLGHEPVWVESQSQLRREAEKRGLVNVVRREESYYAKQRKEHQERLHDTGNAYPETERQPARGRMEG